MITSPDPLPGDLETAHQLIRELLETLSQQLHLNAKLRHQLEQLLRHRYGRKGEQVDPGQLWLFAQEILPQAEPEPETTPPPEPDPEPEPPPSTTKKKKGHGRKPLPARLPRKPVVHDIPPEQLPCPDCGTMRCRIGEEVREQLEYVPASLIVIEHIRPKYACPDCAAHVVIADRLPEPIEKGLPGPGLMAHVITNKYADHCVQGEAVHEMRVGLSRSGCRTGPQTAGVLRWSRAIVVSVLGKGATRSRQVRVGKASASEPLMTCRKHRVSVETGVWWLPRDKHWRSLLTASVTSGIKAARVRLRLMHGTLEPVVSMPRETPKWKPHEGQSTEARHRGGTARSSDEGRVMRPERRGRVIHVSPRGSTAQAGGIHGGNEAVTKDGG